MNSVHEQLATILTTEEGEKLKAYDDATGKVINPGTMVKGNVTIGIGRNLIGYGITKDESKYLFNNNVTEIEQGLDEFFPWWRKLAEPRQIVLMDFAFNQGVPKLVHQWPNTMAALSRGEYQRVAKSMRKTPWYQQVGKSRGEMFCTTMETGRFK